MVQVLSLHLWQSCGQLSSVSPVSHVLFPQMGCIMQLHDVGLQVCPVGQSVLVAQVAPHCPFRQ